MLLQEKKKKKVTWSGDNWPWDLEPRAIFCLVQLVLAHAQRFNPWPGSLLPFPDLLGSGRNTGSAGFKEQFTLGSSWLISIQVFPCTDEKEVARVTIKSLPMEESHDKTNKKPTKPNKIYQPSNQNQTETTNKVRITTSVCGVLSFKKLQRVKVIFVRVLARAPQRLCKNFLKFSLTE